METHPPKEIEDQILTLAMENERLRKYNRWAWVFALMFILIYLYDYIM
jgi:hypothetical protein